jgi:hypothetical protein
MTSSSGDATTPTDFNCVNTAVDTVCHVRLPRQRAVQYTQRGSGIAVVGAR